MRLHHVLGAAVLATTLNVSVIAQQTESVQLAPSRPFVTINFDKATLLDALTTLGQRCGISVEFAEDVADDQKTQLVTARFVRATFQDALSLLLRERNLVFKVLDPTKVRIQTKTP